MTKDVIVVTHIIKVRKKVISEVLINENEGKAVEIIKKSVQTEKDETLKCKLCRECIDGNSEVKKHLLKEHYDDKKRKKGEIQCGYNYCIDIEGDKCSLF